MKKGFHTATTKEIAEATGVSEATLFKYFKNKDNLLKEIMFELVVKLKNETIEKTLSPLENNRDYSATQKLEYLFKAQSQFFKEHNVAIKIILQELAINETVKTLFDKEIYPITNKVIETIMMEGKKNGEFLDLPTKSLSIGFINILLAPYFTMTFYQMEIDESNQDHNQVLFDIFMNGIKEKRL